MSLSRMVVAMLMIMLMSSAGWATTWSVDQADAGCSDGSCTPCCTIQGAVYKSSGNDVISVMPGNYPENIDFRDMLSVGNITLERRRDRIRSSFPLHPVIPCGTATGISTPSSSMG